MGWDMIEIGHDDVKITAFRREVKLSVGQEVDGYDAFPVKLEVDGEERYACSLTDKSDDGGDRVIRSAPRPFRLGD